MKTIIALLVILTLWFGSGFLGAGFIWAEHMRDTVPYWQSVDDRYSTSYVSTFTESARRVCCVEFLVGPFGFVIGLAGTGMGYYGWMVPPVIPGWR